MWLPAVHPEHGRKWQNKVLDKQLYQRAAQQSLYAPRAMSERYSSVTFPEHRCIVFPDGWVVPFSSRQDGYFVDAVFAPSDQPPSEELLPADCILNATHLRCSAFCFQASVCNKTYGAPAKEGGIAGFPQLTAQELHMWRLMGFPFNRQWRWAFDGTTDHGLTKVPTPVHMFLDLRLLPARMRALPFSKLRQDVSGRVV